MKRTSGKILIGGTCLLIIALLAIAVSSYWQSRSIRNTAQWISHTDSVLYHSQKLLSAVVDAETNARGFALSGSENFLPLFRQTESSASMEINTIKTLTADNADEQKRIDTLAALITTRIGLSKKVITVRQTEGLDAAEKVSILGEGKRYMDSIRNMIASIQSEENSLLQERKLNNEKAATRLDNVIKAVIALILMLMILIFQLIRLELRSRRKIEEQLKTFNEQLEEQVKNKTAELKGIFERVTDAFIALDKDMRYTYLNKKAGEMIHRDPESLIGKNVWDIFPDAVGSDTYNTFMKAMADQQPVVNTDYYAPLDLWQQNHVYPSPEGLSIFINDISEQKRAEEIVKYSEETKRLIMNSALDAIICMDTDGLIISWNPQAERIFGWKEEEIKGRVLADTIIPIQYRERHKKGMQHYLETGEGPVLNKVIEITALNNKGREFPVELTITVIKQNGGAFFCAFIRDITGRKNAEEKLQQSYEDIRLLASHLQEIREEERASMAREIHDELGQQLTGLKMDIAWISKNGKKEEDKEKIENALRMIDKVIITVRKIATELRPSILDDFGLVDALSWQSQEFEKRFGIETQFRSSIENINLAPNIVTGLFRIYQESLTNVARHSKATTVSASLEIVNDQLILKIIDNGTGFDRNKVNSKKTLGLLGMKERTMMMGGLYDIISTPGKGTTVIISVPVMSNAEV